MVDTLTNIQTDARFYANDSALIITSGEELRIFNLVYQGMMSPEYEMLNIRVGRRWPETTQEDTSLTMVVGQEQYTWITSPDFKQPAWIEGIDSNTSEPYPLTWAPDMTAWSGLDYTGNAEPLMCRLIDVGGVVKLAIRPTPVRADTIRVTGLIEATELTQGSDSTIFLLKNSDRALSMLVAAEFKSQRGQSQRALELITNAVSLLPKQDNSPVLTGSGRILPWGGGEPNYGNNYRFNRARLRYGR